MEPFKNLLGAQAARKIAKAFLRADCRFNSRSFLKNIEQELHPLELKQRSMFLMRRLEEVLPQSPSLSFPILEGALRQNETDTIGLAGFQVWPLTQFVATHGLKDFELSMTALHQMTQVFTAEFAIRPFLELYEERTLRRLLVWTKDPSDHVRRLCSEGSRPLLPWGQRLSRFVQNPRLTWALLENLRFDPAVYVQKSVANHLNDHSKNHADWLIKELCIWKERDPGHDSLNWIIRHGTRTLIKKGHRGALRLHGIGSSKVAVISTRLLTKKVKLGEKLLIEVTLRNPTRKSLNVILDHELMLLRSHGHHGQKIFKGKKLALKPGETLTVSQSIPIKKVTTRTYYPGLQQWAALVNGKKQKSHEFRLLSESASKLRK